MRPDALPPLPSNVPVDSWGWMDRDGLHASWEPSDVVDALAKDTDKTIVLAWRPEVEGFVGARRLRPVYDVLPDAALGRDAAARVRTRGRERNGLLLSIAAVAGLTYLLLSGGGLPPLVVIGILLFGMSPFERAIDFIDNRVSERIARRDPGLAARRGAARTRYGVWASRQGRSVAGSALVGAFGLILALQYAVDLGQSVEIAGLVKPRVASEPYRLLTSAYLHIGVVHLVFNGMMTLALARVLDPLIGAGRIFWVFVLGALLGNLGSYWLLPAPSAGASGGIMALVGALAGLSWRRPELRVVGLLRIAVRILVLMAVVGLVGAHMIDNAAHAGGALAGVVLGIWFAGRAAESDRQGWRSWVTLSGALVALVPALCAIWLLAPPALRWLQSRFA